MANNDLQNTTQKTKDWLTRTPLKPEVSLGVKSILRWNINRIDVVMVSVFLSSSVDRGFESNQRL
jgi:hypothetical protein